MQIMFEVDNFKVYSDAQLSTTIYCLKVSGYDHEGMYLEALLSL